MESIWDQFEINLRLKTQKIAIIGPADYVNKELPDTHGKYIDENFDIVIRLNSMLNIENKELEKYYGKKFDILMSSFWNENRFWETIDNKIDKIKKLIIDNFDLFKKGIEKKKKKIVFKKI